MTNLPSNKANCSLYYGLLVATNFSDAGNIHIYSDCIDAIQSVICYTNNNWSRQIINLAVNYEKGVTLKWVPAHCGIDGNERTRELTH